MMARQPWEDRESPLFEQDKNTQIMFRISWLLLVAVANGLYAPQQPRFASRARPVAAAEGRGGHKPAQDFGLVGILSW